MTKKLRILLADDDKDDRFFFNKALSSLSVETELLVVENGEKLMSYLAEHIAKLPDVLFLDINMPKKNGSECLLEIKSNANMRGLPVIMYSTSLHGDVADVLYENGAHYYVQKTDFTELPEILNKALELIKDAGPRPTRDKFILSLQKHA
ncbi:MAG: response regulator [Bacteroidia bacterium]